MLKSYELQKSATPPQPNGRDHIALQLGHYVAGLSFGILDAKTKEAVMRCVLDTLVSAAAALALPGVKASQHAAQALYGAGRSTLWFTRSDVSEAAALYANSAAACALDLDDGNRMARGHPGAAVIPTALALAYNHPQITVQDFMAAVVAGYEVGIRMATAKPNYAPSGSWSGFAVVATAGRMLGVNAEIIAQALAIAAQTAPALPALAGLAGSDLKEGIPAGVASGWAALQLAQAGFAGPTAMLDDPELFDLDTILHNLDGRPLINSTYFKIFGCCRHIHAPLEAFLHLQAIHGFSARDIVKMDVYTYRATFNLSNKPHPLTLVEAQYSVPYCLALCAVQGSDALLPLETCYLSNAEVIDLAERVQVVHDASIEPLFPIRSPAWVAVNLANGVRLESPLMDPRGDPDRPLTWDDLEHKLTVATRSTLSETQQRTLLDGVAALRKEEWEPLLRALDAQEVAT